MQRCSQARAGLYDQQLCSDVVKPLSGLQAGLPGSRQSGNALASSGGASPLGAARMASAAGPLAASLLTTTAA